MATKNKAKSTKKRTHSQSDSDSESEHELYYYCNDRVQLMKEVIKILKLKKIKALAPPGIKKMDIEEMNTLLLEELLGISNKRLKKILEGQNADDESSSSDEDKVDVISLDSISDDEICFVDETTDDKNYKKAKAKCRHRKRRVKKENDLEKVKTEVKIKKEKSKTDKVDKPTGLENEKLLSVLELLELQARARAIRSQLALDAENKAKEAAEALKNTQNIDESDDDAIIIETPAVKEIVISSSDSESEIVVENNKNEDKKQEESIEIIESVANDDNTSDQTTLTSVTEKSNSTDENKQNKQKIKLIRSILVEPSTSASKNSIIQSGNEDNVDLNEIPLPGMINNSLETDQCALEKPEKLPKEVEVVGDSVPEVQKDLTTHKSEVNLVFAEVNSKDSGKEKKRDDKPIAIDHDDEPDVIRLDIVEIDGIDD